MKEKMSDAVSILKKHYGHTSFRGAQEEVITNALSGQDVLYLAATGSGKSVCYQIPAMLSPGITVVISPLISLMKDQVDALQSRGIAATYINSTLSPTEVKERLSGIKGGVWKLLYVAPEQIATPHFNHVIEHLKVSYIAVDEAHCISQWGHDFRTSYRLIKDLITATASATVIAFTATAPQIVVDDIGLMLGVDLEVVSTNLNRPEIKWEVRNTPTHERKIEAIREILKSEAAIIFTTTISDAEMLAQELGLSCYHGRLDAREKTRRQEEWMSTDTTIVATSAFGMGIDKYNVRTVIHYSTTSSVTAYYQEAGRAARDGLPARAILLWSMDDCNTHRYFIDQSCPTIETMRSLYRMVSAYKHINIGKSHIEAKLGISPSQVNVGLELLEEAGLGVWDGAAWHPFKNTQRVDMVALLQPRLQHKQSKTKLLNEMIEYATSEHVCRRERLLANLGETSSTSLEKDSRCCDICNPDISTRTITDTHKLVIEAAKQSSFIGRKLLAQVLAGSRAKKALRRKANWAYGALKHLTIVETQDIIDDLLELGLLAQAQGEYRSIYVTKKCR